MSDSKRLGDVVFFGNDVWVGQKINSFSVLCTNIFVWNMFQNLFYFCNGWKKDTNWIASIILYVKDTLISMSNYGNLRAIQDY